VVSVRGGEDFFDSVIPTTIIAKPNQVKPGETQSRLEATDALAASRPLDLTCLMVSVCVARLCI